MLSSPVRKKRKTVICILAARENKLLIKSLPEGNPGGVDLLEACSIIFQPFQPVWVRKREGRHGKVEVQERESLLEGRAGSQRLAGKTLLCDYKCVLTSKVELFATLIHEFTVLNANKRCFC